MRKVPKNSPVASCRRAVADVRAEAFQAGAVGGVRVGGDGEGGDAGDGGEVAGVGEVAEGEVGFLRRSERRREWWCRGSGA